MGSAKVSGTNYQFFTDTPLLGIMLWWGALSVSLMGECLHLKLDRWWQAAALKIRHFIISEGLPRRPPANILVDTLNTSP